MSRLLTLALVLLTQSVAVSAAQPSFTVGPVLFDVVRVYDGDTFTAQAYPWPNVTFTTGIRISGIDTPELNNSGCERARQTAVAARNYTAAALANARTRALTNISEDKYGGRVDATVLLDGRNLAEMLIEQGLAKPYTGGTKPAWCP